MESQSSENCSLLGVLNCYDFSGSFSGIGPRLFWFLIILGWVEGIKTNLLFFSDCKRGSPSQHLISSVSLSDPYQRLSPVSLPPSLPPSTSSERFLSCVKPDHGVHLCKTCQWPLMYWRWLLPHHAACLDHSASTTRAPEGSCLGPSPPGYHPSHLPFC